MSRIGVQRVMTRVESRSLEASTTAPGKPDDRDREAELALVARLKAGDSDAFDAVHGAFNVRLFNFLARLSRRLEIREKKRLKAADVKVSGLEEQVA